MDESLIQQYYMNEDGQQTRCKVLSLRRIMTVLKKRKSRLILVPAAAVKREGQALFIMTGRKESVDCKVS